MAGALAGFTSGSPNVTPAASGVVSIADVTRATRSTSAPAIDSSGIDDVLVARIASGRAFFSTAANTARLASTFSKIASMTTSARATPSPAISGIRRSVASRTRRGSLRRSPKSLDARANAGARRAASWSCSVTVSPRSAHHAAMSPPIVPAPTTCTWRVLASLSLPSALSRSCSV